MSFVFLNNLIVLNLFGIVIEKCVKVIAIGHGFNR